MSKAQYRILVKPSGRYMAQARYKALFFWWPWQNLTITLTTYEGAETAAMNRMQYDIDNAAKDNVYKEWS